jgi:hypothetical protein
LLDDGRGGFRTCDLSRVKRDDLEGAKSPFPALRRRRFAGNDPRRPTKWGRIRLDVGGYGH